MATSLPPHDHLIATSLPPHCHLIATSLPPHCYLIASHSYSEQNGLIAYTKLTSLPGASRDPKGYV